MTPSILAVLALASLAIWCVLLVKVFVRIRQRHAQVHAAMGHPTPRSFDMAAVFVTASRLLLLRRHTALGDRELSRLCDAALVVLGVYVVVFFMLLAALFATGRMTGGAF